MKIKNYLSSSLIIFLSSCSFNVDSNLNFIYPTLYEGNYYLIYNVAKNYFEMPIKFNSSISLDDIKEVKIVNENEEIELKTSDFKLINSIENKEYSYIFIFKIEDNITDITTFSTLHFKLKNENYFNYPIYLTKFDIDESFSYNFQFLDFNISKNSKSGYEFELRYFFKAEENLYLKPFNSLLEYSPIFNSDITIYNIEKEEKEKTPSNLVYLSREYSYIFSLKFIEGIKTYYFNEGISFTFLKNNKEINLIPKTDSYSYTLVKLTDIY